MHFKHESRSAFREIFDAYYSLLCAIAYDYTKDVSASESITQDAFLSLWEKHADSSLVSSPKAYLITCVKNGSIDFLRVRNRTRHVDIEHAMNACFISEQELFEEYIASELEEKISSAVASLPDECRRVFRLSRYENKSYPEISEILHISVNTVKYHMKNALSLLRVELQDYLSVALIAYSSFYF